MLYPELYKTNYSDSQYSLSNYVVDFCLIFNFATQPFIAVILSFESWAQ